MNDKSLSLERLRALLDAADMNELDDDALLAAFEGEHGISSAAPDGSFAEDPRSGTIVVYNPARAKRPHHHPVVSTTDLQAMQKPCPICSGNTTRVVDVRPLSDGVTFINKNLFPCVFDGQRGVDGDDAIVPFQKSAATRSRGLHFLQWTSSRHHMDWHNMKVADLTIVMSRLAALEKKLLLSAARRAPNTAAFNPGVETFGFVSIIKNFGVGVGGSLAHGHQQIVHSNVMPAQIYMDRKFLLERGLSVAAHLLNSDAVLRVRDFDHAVLLVPPFMLRPYHMMLVFKDATKRFLFELSDAELSSAAAGWSAAAGAVMAVLPGLGREPSYNVVVHNGPSGGLYIEFHPYTQETGGLEHLGFFVCHETPQTAAAQLRAVVATY